MLVFDDVRYAYEGTSMRFDLAVERGEWLAVIGPSGAGKSTLLDLAAGFIQPMAGRIVMGGQDMAGRSPGERPVSLVFQENNLFAHLSALDNVVIGLSTRLRPPAQDVAAAAGALTAVGLGGFEKRLPAAMSGGERQRVALARALARRRPILLLDEPFAALGPAMRQDMLELMAHLRQEADLTIIMVTHQPEDAVGFVDRVAYVEAGEIAVTGTPAEILGPPPHPRLAAYLA